jgi:protein SCO1/2
MKQHHYVSRSEIRQLCLMAIVLLSCFVFQACTKSEAQTRYEFKGKVVNVDKKGRVVTIAHEEIKDYMDAMTMPFHLKDESYLNIMQEGDKVTATLVITDSRSWLEEIVVSQEQVDKSAKPAKSFEPNAGDEMPDYSLINQDGKPIHFAQYKGRALLLTFIYTRCPLPDYCPLMTSHFAEVNKTLKADAALYAKTHLLSISVDPEYDKPTVLRAYGLRHNEQKDFEHWELATGKPEEVKKVAEYFGLAYQTEDNQIIHNLQTALIAPDGKFVKMYRGNDWKPAEVIMDIKKLNLN